MVIIALPLGVYAATHHRRAGDYLAMLVSQLGIACPRSGRGCCSYSCSRSSSAGCARAASTAGAQGWWTGLKALLLPAIALGAFQAAVLVRATRSAVLEILREDYVRTARAKGWRRSASSAGTRCVTR